MFYLTYLRRELSRRARRAILTISGLAIGIGLAIAITSTSNGLDRAQAKVLSPLTGVGTDLLLTRSVQAQAGQQNSEDMKALRAERAAAEQASVLDLSTLGKPGDHFERDFFLPTTLLTFPANKAIEMAGLAGVASVATGLTVLANHRAGTVPEIIAEYQPQLRTIDVSPPSEAEQAAMRDCQQQFIASLPRPTGPPPPPIPRPTGSLPPPQNPTGTVTRSIPFTHAYYACLPERMRQIQIQQEVIRQVIDPPQTDISTTGFTLAGVDIAASGLGLLTPTQIVQGTFFSAQAEQKQAILEEGYAQRKELTVGSTLAINGTSFKVVGLAQPPLGGMVFDVYLPLSDLQQLSGRPGRINIIMTRATQASEVERVSREVTAAFPEARVASAKTLAGQVTGSLMDAARVADRLGWILALVVLGAAFLLASVLTLSSVGKRVRELGTLRAIGWRASRVVRQIVSESLALGILGGLLGVVLGIVAAVTVTRLAPPLEVTARSLAGGERLLRPAMHQAIRLEPQLDIIIIIGALGLTILGGLLAGVTGSIRAARLRPSEALRHLG